MAALAQNPVQLMIAETDVRGIARGLAFILMGGLGVFLLGQNCVATLCFIMSELCCPGMSPPPLFSLYWFKYLGNLLVVVKEGLDCHLSRYEVDP